MCIPMSGANWLGCPRFSSTVVAEYAMARTSRYSSSMGKLRCRCRLDSGVSRVAREAATCDQFDATWLDAVISEREQPDDLIEFKFRR